MKYNYNATIYIAFAVFRHVSRITVTVYKTLSYAVIGLACLLLAGCGTAPNARNAQTASGAIEYPARLTFEQAGDVTIYAIGLVGTPYRYGGNTPDSGFDCSGLIGHVYRTHSQVTPPRTVANLNGWGNPVAPDRVRSGDLVIFTQRGQVNHAGIYVGQGRFVHAPSTGGEVRLDYLTSHYWSKQQVAYRRP